jgi:hypothetical protein
MDSIGGSLQPSLRLGFPWSVSGGNLGIEYQIDGLRYFAHWNLAAVVEGCKVIDRLMRCHALQTAFARR